MNTVFLLMAEFDTSQIPLAKICGKYLDMDLPTAIRKAKVQQLPFPAFRIGSQRSPYLVNVIDLASYLDERREKAKHDWTRMKNTAA